ncbi:EpsG family protein [Oceanirhabdus sp. W0125-5]|uniref:EpsG family protein n=1 Tax=Oceanirhabdus sp. W0125-5 TaxID=2999116 RepID=UPI0022F2D1B6|nr:EpsG family protein [Oceanirhabdus sp. W0125-5]WBW98950.1 EpsG family protein [Oceanirhabdus sp. W0125-5]
MKIFYITLILVTIIAYLARIYSSRFKVMDLLYTVFVIAILVIVAGLRTNIGDTEMYSHLFKIADESSIYSGAYESGFIRFILFLKSLSDDPQLLIFITSLITHSLNILTMRAYSKCFELATYLYITSGYYIAAMNGIRQSLVASVLFVSTKFIIEGKFVIYSIIVITVSRFHSSALIMIPVYFLVRLEAWSPKMKKILILCVIVMPFFQPLMNSVFGLLENTKYGAYSEFDEGGVNILRVMIAAVPVVLSYIKREELKDKWPKSNVFVNMALLNLIIMTFSLYNWIFARFVYYTQLYAFILIPYIIKNCFKKEEKRLLYYFCIVLYFIFFYYEHVITLNIHYRSYFISI